MRPGPSIKWNEFHGKSALAPPFFLEGSNLSISEYPGHRRTPPFRLFHNFHGSQCHKKHLDVVERFREWHFSESLIWTCFDWQKNMTLRRNAKNGINIQACIKKKVLNQDNCWKGMTRLSMNNQLSLTVNGSPGHPKLSALAVPKNMSKGRCFVLDLRTVEVAMRSRVQSLSFILWHILIDLRTYDTRQTSTNWMYTC